MASSAIGVAAAIFVYSGLDGNKMLLPLDVVRLPKLDVVCVRRLEGLEPRLQAGDRSLHGFDV